MHVSARPRNRRTVCAAAEINRLVRAFLPWGLHSEGGLGVGVGWGVRSAPLPCPHIPCFTSKMHAIQLSSSGLDVACGAAQLRAQVAACPSSLSLQQTGHGLQGGGVRSAVSRDQLQALEALPRPCISTGQRDSTPPKVSTLRLS